MIAWYPVSSVIIAVFGFTAELLRNATAIKEENDLTV